KRRSGLSSIGNRWKIAESAVSERQRIVSFSAFQADSASPRFVSAHTASRDPPVILPPLHLASGVELLAGDAKPPVRRRTDSGRFRNDRVAASAGGRCDRRVEHRDTNSTQCLGPTRVTKMLSLREWNRRDAPNTCPGAREAGAQTVCRRGAGPVGGLARR